MRRLLRNFRLNRTINQYVRVLAPALAKRYGMADQYTVLQIQKTAQDLRLPMRYMQYAVALFRHVESANTLAYYKVCQEELDCLRGQVADGFFNGNRNYRARDVIRLATPRGWRGGNSPDWYANYWGKTSL